MSAEVIATDFEGMVREGEVLAALHPRIVVKLPCTAAGIRAVKYFAAKDIRTNCTLVFSVGQALLAAKAGATYVSPFVGRLDDISEDGVALVAHIVKVYRTYGYKTQVLAASIRHTQHIIQCLDAGADVATCPFCGNRRVAQTSDDEQRAGEVPHRPCTAEYLNGNRIATFPDDIYTLECTK